MAEVVWHVSGKLQTTKEGKGETRGLEPVKKLFCANTPVGDLLFSWFVGGYVARWTGGVGPNASDVYVSGVKRVPVPL